MLNNKDMLVNYKKNILLVDDSDTMLHILRGFFKDTQYRLICAISGRMALSFLSKNQPDLFILDIEMPEIDGYELACKIRQAGQNAPIIFLTGNSTKEYLEKALEVGASDFIAKPICREKLFDRINKLLAK